MMSKFLSASALALALVSASAGAAKPDDSRVAALEAQVAKLTQVATASQDRNAVQNLFGRYMTLHSDHRTDRGQTMDLLPPVPYRTISETFEY